MIAAPRRRAAFAAAAAAVAAAAASGCGGGDEGGRLWFVDGYVSALGMRGKIAAVERPRAASPARAVGELLKGPTQRERDEGLITAIPRGTLVESIAVANGTVRVRLVSRTPTHRWEGVYASAQIVYTLTEFDEVDRVRISVNGEPCCMYDLQNRPTRRPLSRRVFRGWQGDPLPPPG